MRHQSDRDFKTTELCQDLCPDLVEREDTSRRCAYLKEDNCSIYCDLHKVERALEAERPIVCKIKAKVGKIKARVSLALRNMRRDVNLFIWMNLDFLAPQWVQELNELKLVDDQ